LSEHESCCEEEYTCEAQQVTSPEAATNIFLHRPPSVAEIYERAFEGRAARRSSE
jgi:hypothetical protein